MNLTQMERLVRYISDMVNEGRQVVVVTSGAMGAGTSRLGLKERPRTIPEKQAVCAVGQSILMETYGKLFAEYNQVVAQILLTREDITERRRHLNARHTLIQLLRMSVVPIVNENDTVAVDEIKFGQNDTLASLVAGLIGADLLIILTDVDGLYSMDPKLGKGERIPLVTEITPEIEALAGGPGSHLGSGGMMSKIQAARIATLSGSAVVIAHGRADGILRRILNGESVGTLFVPSDHKLGSRKRWIAFYQQPQGDVIVDEGAARALVAEGKSLLPSGIVGVHGFFEEGHLVRILDEKGNELARGLSNYKSEDIRQIRGMKTSQISEKLGHKIYDEVVHRDNMVLSTRLKANGMKPDESGGMAASGAGGELHG